jgi:Ni2+-binding GTPase involved in maturation of urease and hydrogenase
MPNVSDRPIAPNVPELVVHDNNLNHVVLESGGTKVKICSPATKSFRVNVLVF